MSNDAAHVVGGLLNAFSSLMQLAVFDLDHTLMPLDTGELWVRWLLRESGRDPRFAVSEIERFTREYRAGILDINEFVDFQLKFLASFKRSFLEKARAAYKETIVRPNVPESSRRLVQMHKDAGHVTAICTATYSFVTQTAADIFGVDALLATRPQEGPDGEFTGKIDGTASFGPGKVVWLKNFIRQQQETMGRAFDRIWFYSDSMADRPLFEYVESKGGVNTVVNGEAKLIELAGSRGYFKITTFAESDLEFVRRIQQSLIGA